MDSMHNRIRSGLAWKVASQVFRQLSRVAVVVILARLLTPAEYGVAAMVLVFSSLVLIFTDLALGAALVQREELSERRPLDGLLDERYRRRRLHVPRNRRSPGRSRRSMASPRCSRCSRSSPLSFLVTALGTAHSALLNREMRFQSLELRMMAGTFVGGIVGIAVAYAGYGAWAIIWQQLAIAAVSTAFLWAFSPWRPRFIYSGASLRSLGGFSANVFGTRVLFYMNRKLDHMLIGRFLGAAALGAYAVAYNVMLMPLSRIAQPIVEVLFPAMARIQDDRKRMAAMWLRANRMIGAMSIPAMVGLMIVAPEFVATLFG